VLLKTVFGEKEKQQARTSKEVVSRGESGQRSELNSCNLFE